MAGPIRGKPKAKKVPAKLTPGNWEERSSRRTKPSGRRKHVGGRAVAKGGEKKFKCRGNQASLNAVDEPT